MRMAVHQCKAFVTHSASALLRMTTNIRTAMKDPTATNASVGHVKRASSACAATQRKILSATAQGGISIPRKKNHTRSIGDLKETVRK